MKEKEFLQEVKEINLLQQALGILDWDTQTGMPEKASAYRSEVDSYLYSIYFSKKIGPKIKEAIRYFSEHPEELSEVGTAVFAKVKEEYDLEHRVPEDLMRKYTAAVSSAHGQWQKARETQQFSDFQHALNQNIELTKQLIPYWRKDEKTNYDVLLNQYEPGMTVEILDKVFDQLKEGILSIRRTLQEKGTEPETDFLNRRMTKKQQKRFVVKVIEQLGYDFSRGRLDDTVHPFMTGINPNDARITTRWNETDFKMAVFGVIHEAGHGMYEQDIDDKYAYTPVYEGTSMGIHESQSLFNEIIIGSSRSFWKKQYPFFQECAEGTFVVTRLILDVLGKLLVNRGWVLKRLIRPAIVFPRNRHVLFPQRATVNLIRALVRRVVADNRLNFDQRWPASLLRVADCLGNRVQVSTILNQLVIPVGSLKAGGSTFVRTQAQRPIEGHIV